MYGENKTVLKLFKNKFFIITLIVVCVLTIIMIVLNLTGHSNIVSDIMNAALYPFQKFADFLKTSVNGFFLYFTEFNSLKEENETLKEKIKSMEKLEIENAELAEENENLYKYYDLKREHTDFKLCYAEIIAREADNYLSVITVNRGSFHGIEKGMTAVSGGDNLVGIVSEVDYLSSKITLFIKAGTSIGAYVKRTKGTGFAEGDFKYEKDSLAIFSSKPKNSKIRENDIILTSGIGDQYPGNLVIGEVIETSPNANTQTLDGIIKPAADLDNITDVMIITDFERKFD